MIGVEGALRECATSVGPIAGLVEVFVGAFHAPYATGISVLG